ncbi:hypothetical protein [Streptomyces flavofungini]|uniref:hypothetical protein n=1 Tax=Streptomyces flavofungini TaxID=68200 RepID=UPI0034E05426
MTLARYHDNSATDWWIIFGALALYVLARWFFVWRQARSEGRRQPARSALHELGDDDNTPGMPPERTSVAGYQSWRQFTGLVSGALVIGVTVALTDGALRVALLSVVVPLLVIVLAYVDFREARKARAKRERTGGARRGRVVPEQGR